MNRNISEWQGPNTPSLIALLNRNELLFLLHIARLSIRLKNVRCGVKMNFSAVFTWISIMLRPTQAQGKLTAFKSRFILSYLCMYPNIQLPGLVSQTLPHNRVEFVVSFSLQPLLLINVLLCSCLHENWDFKFPIWPRVQVCLGSSVSTRIIFIQLKFAK